MPNSISVNEQQVAVLKSANDFNLDLNEIDLEKWQAYADWFIKKYKGLLVILLIENEKLRRTLLFCLNLISQVRSSRDVNFKINILLKIASLFDKIMKERNPEIKIDYVPNAFRCLSEREYQYIRRAENFDALQRRCLYQLFFSPNFCVIYSDNILRGVKKYIARRKTTDSVKDAIEHGLDLDLGMRRAINLMEKVEAVIASAEPNDIKIRQLVLLSACIECPPENVSSPSLLLKELLRFENRNVPIYTSRLAKILLITDEEMRGEYNQLIRGGTKMLRAVSQISKEDCAIGEEMTAVLDGFSAVSDESVSQNHAMQHQSSSHFFSGHLLAQKNKRPTSTELKAVDECLFNGI